MSLQTIKTEMDRMIGELRAALGHRQEELHQRFQEQGAVARATEAPHRASTAPVLTLASIIDKTPREILELKKALGLLPPRRPGVLDRFLSLPPDPALPPAPITGATVQRFQEHKPGGVLDRYFGPVKPATMLRAQEARRDKAGPQRTGVLDRWLKLAAK
jgi:hypothetical protein